MQHFFHYFTLTGGTIYAVLLFFFYRGLRKLQPVQLDPGNDLPTIAVVVAAHNEEEHIETTVWSLANQTYPPDRYEIVVVDDRSSDRTPEILQKLLSDIENLRIVTIKEPPGDISPKKRALLTAVDTVQTEFIAGTDGDCVHHPDWLRNFASAISDDLGVATAMTIFAKNPHSSLLKQFWQEMQNIEQISEHLITAGASGLGLTLSANGGNILFNRALYQHSGKLALNGEVTSGDDFFLIQAAEKRGYRTRFLIDQASIVHSNPEETIPEVINQRARWASKIRFGDFKALPILILIFFFYLMVLLYPLTLFNGHFDWEFFVLILGLKIIPDTAYIVYGFSRFHLKLHWINYIAMQILHIPFILVSAMKGILFGFTWKGTKYKK